jgi:hypothetical protein
MIKTLSIPDPLPQDLHHFGLHLDHAIANELPAGPPRLNGCGSGSHSKLTCDSNRDLAIARVEVHQHKPVHP